MTIVNRYKFWSLMAAFQIIFGLTIFSVTRLYYLDESANISTDSVAIRQPSPGKSDPTFNFDSTKISASTFSQLDNDDPVIMEGQANELFANGQHAEAADLYARLLAIAPNNVRTYNNLGLTLHYIGSSSEALRNLNAGVAIDPTFQRIWLTLGYVNSQLGNTEQARSALTTAVKLGAGSPIGQSAAEMLEELR